MRRVSVTMLLATLIAPQSFAGNRENAMHHIAQVMAAASLCHSIEPQTTLLALVATGNGIDMERDQPKMLDEALRLKASMANFPEDAVCSSALALYGPGGLNVSGLVRKK